MELNAIMHRSAFTDAYALDRNTVVLNIRTGKDVTGVELICEDPFAFGISGDIKWVGKRVTMRVKRELKRSLIWTTEIRPEHKRLQYYFELHGNGEKYILMEDDFYTEETLDLPGRWKQYFKFPWLNASDVIAPPAWVEDTVWYQIMPDRFCRSGATPSRMPLKDWEDRESVTGGDFYGGDLRGIIEKLPHLRDLGITGIYLLPLFLSDTNHKYNTFDYETIDPDFGTEDDMKELVETAHSMGIRVMVDAVFNHCGTEFLPWKDVWEKGEASPYFDWFCINHRPFERKYGSLRDGRFFGFAFLDMMPKLNTGCREVTDYFTKICRHWVEAWRIDGIRFDVGNEVSHTFLKSLCGTLKAIKPDLFLLGEIWHDSVQWLQGDEYDAVMNYPFYESLHNFWVDSTADSKEFMYAMNRVYSLYPEQLNRCTFNFLDTHDTMRALNRCGSRDILYQQLAVLMTMPGSACLYYGTEVAMPGGHDPDCRRTMPWRAIENGEFDSEIREIRALTALRRENDAIRGTEILWHHDTAHPRLISYERPGKEESIFVSLNAGTEGVSIPSNGTVLYSRKLTGSKLESGGVVIIRR